MPCNRIREQLDSYLDSALDSEQTALVRAHLDHCSACTGELQEIEAFETAATAIPPKEPSSGFTRAVMHAIDWEEVVREKPNRWWNKIISRPYQFALAGGLLALALIMLLPFSPESDQPEPVFSAFFNQKKGTATLHPGNGTLISSLPQDYAGERMITKGDRVITSQNGILTVTLDDNVWIDLSSETTVNFTSEGVFIPGGQARLRFLPRHTPFIVQSPHLAARIVGTELILKVLPNESELSLLSGEILVSSAFSPAQAVTGPASIHAGSDGTLKVIPARKPVNPDPAETSKPGRTDKHEIRTPAGVSKDSAQPAGPETDGDPAEYPVETDFPGDIESPRDILKP